VIGNAGGGKTRLSRILSDRFDLPYFAIDDIQWQPGWIPTPDTVYNKKHALLIAQQRWVLDGYGSWDSVLTRMNAADTIIFVDHAIWVHYWWATKRLAVSLWTGRPDGPGWRMSFRLYTMIWWLHKHRRQALFTEAVSRSQVKRLIHLQSPSALNRFIDNPV